MTIEHIVVLMLENNSFDRMLGSLPGVNGIDSANPRSNPDPSGECLIADSHDDAGDVMRSE